MSRMTGRRSWLLVLALAGIVLICLLLVPRLIQYSQRQDGATALPGKTRQGDASTPPAETRRTPAAASTTSVGISGQETRAGTIKSGHYCFPCLLTSEDLQAHVSRCLMESVRKDWGRENLPTSGFLNSYIPLGDDVYCTPMSTLRTALNASGAVARNDWSGNQGSGVGYTGIDEEEDAVASNSTTAPDDRDSTVVNPSKSVVVLPFLFAPNTAMLRISLSSNGLRTSMDYVIEKQQVDLEPAFGHLLMKAEEASINIQVISRRDNAPMTTVALGDLERSTKGDTVRYGFPAAKCQSQIQLSYPTLKDSFQEKLIRTRWVSFRMQHNARDMPDQVSEVTSEGILQVDIQSSSDILSLLALGVSFGSRNSIEKIPLQAGTSKALELSPVCGDFTKITIPPILSLALVRFASPDVGAQIQSYELVAGDSSSADSYHYIGTEEFDKSYFGLFWKAGAADSSKNQLDFALREVGSRIRHPFISLGQPVQKEGALYFAQAYCILPIALPLEGTALSKVRAIGAYGKGLFKSPREGAIAVPLFQPEAASVEKLLFSMPDSSPIEWRLPTPAKVQCNPLATFQLLGEMPNCLFHELADEVFQGLDNASRSAAVGPVLARLPKQGCRIGTKVSIPVGHGKQAVLWCPQGQGHYEVVKHKGVPVRFVLEEPLTSKPAICVLREFSADRTKLLPWRTPQPVVGGACTFPVLENTVYQVAAYVGTDSQSLTNWEMDGPSCGELGLKQIPIAFTDGVSSGSLRFEIRNGKFLQRNEYSTSSR